MINLIAPINNLGYGVAGYNFLKQLHKINQSVTLYPVAQPEAIGDQQMIGECVNNQINYQKDRPCVKIWHQHDLQSRVGKGKYFGFPIFELTKFNPHEIVSLNHCDEIMVCSGWAKDVILNNADFNKEQVHVVPLGVDSSVFHPALLSSRSTTIFFNCGKWEKRKGHDVLLDCFNKAFEYNDDVELWMMCDNPFIGSVNGDWSELYKNSKLSDKIRVIPRQKTQQDVRSIMALTDCGVFPSRAEGWNLELLEMMATGKHVITTNYSAHTEFCNKDNSHLIDIENLETAYDGLFFNDQCGLWAEFADNQNEQLISHMRNIHNKKQNNELDVNFSGIKTAEKFSWENSVKEMINGIGL
jgi:glycosyltransferase involved in cell wall biosynthesis